PCAQVGPIAGLQRARSHAPPPSIFFRSLGSISTWFCASAIIFCPHRRRYLVSCARQPFANMRSSLVATSSARWARCASSNERQRRAQPLEVPPASGGQSALTVPLVLARNERDPLFARATPQKARLA